MLAEKGANILRLDHRRGTQGIWLTDVEIEITLETRGRAHVDEMVDSLITAGYAVKRG
jgi:threonine dehydratase